MRKQLIILIAALFIIQNNCATTTLLKTGSEYRPVSPAKLRLGCSIDLPTDKFEPTIALNLTTENLHQKVQFEHYKTSYHWRNRLLFLGVTGLSIWATINWWDYAVEDTSGKWYPARIFGILGIGFGLYSAALESDKFPSKPKLWSKETVIHTDTIYKNSKPLSKKTITIMTPWETRSHSLQTGEDGKVLLDIRDVYGSAPEDSNLLLKIKYENLSTDAVIPKKYVVEIRNYEIEAQSLFKQAEAKEEKGKYEEAMGLYELVLEKFPKAKISPEARTKIGIMQNKINEKKIAEVRKKLKMVSDNKVRSVIAGLGLDEYQANALANAIENLSQSSAVSVMKEGLGMPLTDDECVAEYRNLTRFQKFYAVICYLNKCSDDLESAYKRGEEISEEDYWYQIAHGLNISEEIIYKLLSLKPENLIKK